MGISNCLEGVFQTAFSGVMDSLRKKLSQNTGTINAIEIKTMSNTKKFISRRSPKIKNTSKATRGSIYKMTIGLLKVNVRCMAQR